MKFNKNDRYIHSFALDCFETADKQRNCSISVCTMKRSNSASMITDLLSGMEREEFSRRRNSVCHAPPSSLRGKRFLSASNASLPAGDVGLSSSSLSLSPPHLWSSPVKHHSQVLKISKAKLVTAFYIIMCLSKTAYLHSLHVR